VLKVIFGRRREELEEAWRRLHNKKHYINRMPHKILLGWSVKENEMGGACNTHGRDDNCIQNFGRII
jgi:hypothetical protein